VPIDLALAHQAVAIVVLTLVVLQTDRLVARPLARDQHKLAVPLGQPG
jgi:cytochrome c oxidase assembly protein subunit 15